MKGKYWAYLRAIFHKWRTLQRQMVWLRAWRANFGRRGLLQGVHGMPAFSPAFEETLAGFMRG